MSHKQVLLFSILAVSSILSGATFGLLDVFGFVDGRHTISFTLLTTSAVLLYVSLVVVFLLEIAHAKRLHIYLLFSSLLFGVTFFLMNLHVLLTGIAVIGYYLLFVHSSASVTKRFNDFVRFKPQEIFFPVLKSGFLYILILLSLLAYGQSQILISEHALITTDVVKIIIKPSVSMLNQQVNSQLQSDIGDTLAQLPERERTQAIQLVLKKTIENMTDKKTGLVYGIPGKEIPINKAQIDAEGKVNLIPVFDDILPLIAASLNARLTQYALIAPFAIALFTFLIFQPLTIPLQIVEGLITIGLFKILIMTRFISIYKQSVEVEKLKI